MAYQVLARKWRPRLLTEMVGQEPTVRILQNALTQKRIHHAYLFSGTRGVGKTTLGRILARCLNCEDGITATPCGQCAPCQAIDQGKFLDLYEVDAASRTKVEDTRDLLENVQYAPTQGRYKIYLIDEVHMLSNHSFNALLKTLEEPPEHVKFILATTEPKKLPITILSRCLQFHLQRIMPEQIATHLKQICVSEKLTADTAALALLARAADGSMRDALSLLDQAIAFSQASIGMDDVTAMLGCIAQENLIPLLDALAKQDGKLLFELIAQLIARTTDFKQLLDELASLFHQIAMAQVLPDSHPDEMIKKLGTQFTPEDIQIFYQIALLGKRDLGFAPTPQQGFEMTMLRMLAFKPALAQTENSSPVTNSSSSTPKKISVVSQPQAKTHAVSVSVTEDQLDWRQLLPKLGLSGMAYALASNCTLVKLSDNKVELALSIHHEPMLNAKLKSRIQEALSEALQRTLTLEIKVSAADLATPVKQQRQEHEQQLQKATAAILQEPKIKQLIEMCDATIDVSLLN